MVLSVTEITSFLAGILLHLIVVGVGVVVEVVLVVSSVNLVVGLEVVGGSVVGVSVTSWVVVGGVVEPATVVDETVCSFKEEVVKNLSETEIILIV